MTDTPETPETEVTENTVETPVERPRRTLSLGGSRGAAPVEEAAPEEPVVRVRTAMEVTRRAEPKLIEPARFASELTPLGIASNLIGNAFGGDLANVRLALREDDLAPDSFGDRLCSRLRILHSSCQ